MVSVVIPQFGSEELTRTCVESLLAYHAGDVEVIVIDDGTWWGVREDVIPCEAGVVMLLGEHRGVTAAWNLGAGVARGEVVVFLNNDTVTTGAWVERLVQPVLEGGAGMVGVAWREERGVSREQLREMSTTRFLEGWCWGMRRELFLEMGGVDEGMRVYWSDTELQERLCRRGETRQVVEGLSVVHLGHRTTRGLGERREVWERDRGVFLERVKRG
ncbi:glycosyltransferase family 2 protein [Lacunimicrobium album]